MKATVCGHNKVVSLLIEKGANMDLQSENGESVIIVKYTNIVLSNDLVAIYVNYPTSFYLI